MSEVIRVLAVIAIIGYVIGRQLMGEPLRGKRVVLLPVILAVTGIPFVPERTASRSSPGATGSSQHQQLDLAHGSPRPGGGSPRPGGAAAILEMLAGLAGEWLTRRQQWR